MKPGAFTIDRTSGLQKKGGCIPSDRESTVQRSSSSYTCVEGRIGLNPSDSDDSSSDDSDDERTNAHESKAAGSTHSQGVHTKSVELSSALNVDIDMDDIYINTDPRKNPKKQRPQLNQILSCKKDADIMKKSVLTPDVESKFSLPSYEEGVRKMKKQRRAERDKTKGKGWFDLPATELSDERKNDLMILKMRKALDPKRFYKNNDLKALPKYFQFGTIIEGPADFYSARIPKKQRKKTIAEELLADAEFRKFNKRKYAEIQEAKERGTGPYKHMRRLKKKKKR